MVRRGLTRKVMPIPTPRRLINRQYRRLQAAVRRGVAPSRDAQGRNETSFQFVFSRCRPEGWQHHSGVDALLVHRKETAMPALLVPVLWVGGSAILLGGGYYVITHVFH